MRRQRNDSSRVVYWIGGDGKRSNNTARTTAAYLDKIHSDGSTSPHPNISQLHREFEANGFYARIVSDHLYSIFGGA